MTSIGPVTRWMRSFTYYQAGRRPPEVALPDVPEPDERVARRGRRLAYGLAVLAPVLTSVGLWTLRTRIDRSTAVLTLVIPVVLVALIGGRGPAALAAVVAPAAFDVLLVEPYHQLRIHAVEDVEAAVILLVVGLVVGQLVASERQHRVRAGSRGDALAALLAMAGAAAGPATGDDLAEHALAALRTVMDLRECHWSPGYHGAAYPRLLRDGGIADGNSRIAATGPLPASGVELPVDAGPHEFGRIILIPHRNATVSCEHRLVAVAIADILGTALASPRS